MRRLFLAVVIAALLATVVPTVVAAHGSEGSWGHAGKVTICHRDTDGSWHTIRVGAPAARAHLRHHHADYKGSCTAPGPTVTTCTFNSSNALYYSDPARTSQYASGSLTFRWTIATGAFVSPGEWTEVVPPNSGTVYHNVFASGSVTGGAVNLMTATRSPDNYPPFAFTGSLSPFAQTGSFGSTFTGTAAGGYMTAVGTISCGSTVKHHGDQGENEDD